ncbi:glutaredoxin domain-containing protein [Clostridium tetani]|uniref:NrdH-redoxin n=1 Tax=Clostridium tetani TaxID=1513 RepID=A0ABY0EMU4_CLOTA|nr:glutaredoxin domain-containing protein [Clostridium tetani]CDI48897.1 glutaredoxin [Clostridium tetani 12124569]KHO39797.1 glutaredoxin [Clostridium tetani]RXI38461.1 NrdH-redoxin [Clostridium tetani]RXI54219.1 NrdH-redoxin [Clostridium tetani]RXI68881.1 NrdH-redoxin [Clostridium tetani]
MVKVYSTPTCPYCKKAKAYFDSKNIEYKDVNVAQDEKEKEEMIEKSGQQSVPVIDINGEIIVGFNRVAIDKALKEE